VVSRYAGNSDSHTFANLLTDQVEALLPEHRERLFPPTETLSMFLAQALAEEAIVSAGFGKTKR